MGVLRRTLHVGKGVVRIACVAVCYIALAHCCWLNGDMPLHLSLSLLLGDSGEGVRAEALAPRLAWLERDFHRRVDAVVLDCVFLELVAPRAAVLTIPALERLVVQVDALVSHQVALLNKRTSAYAADVATDAHVRAHVACELAPFWRQVLAVRVLTVENVTCHTQNK